MPRFYQNVLAAGRGGFLIILLLSTPRASEAQSSYQHVQIASSPERIVVLDISNASLNREQSEAMAAALSKVCGGEAGFEVVANSSLVDYLNEHSNFSIFQAGHVQALCQNLSVDYVIASTLESLSSGVEASEQRRVNNNWRFTLRLLDGSSGQIIKIFTRECAGDINRPDAFPLLDLLTGLLESPNIIMAIGNDPSEMPLPEAWPFDMSAADADSVAAFPSTSVRESQRRWHWLWYVTGAAVLSGGSAFLLLKNHDNTSTTKAILPAPPDPPSEK